jgi:peptidoglycan/LPS O-acetylase OafA/YrhL
MPWFSYGWLGVELFFIISGFVILMTLETCASFQEFMIRRWLRLFPAMLICSAIIFISASFLPERPLGVPVFRDLLPGISFLDQNVWRHLLGGNQGILEGAFWSLFVEVKFYAIFGALYFVVGRNFATTGIVAACLVEAAANRNWLPLPDIVRSLLAFMEVKHFCWFASGALFYIYYRDARSMLPLLCAILSALLAASLVEPWPSPLAALIFVMLFTSAMCSGDWLRNVLAYPALTFLGFVSYPLYLLHENMVVALIAKIGRRFPSVPDLLLPAIAIAVVVAIAWFVAVFGEPRVRRSLVQTYSKLRNLTGASAVKGEEVLG